MLIDFGLAEGFASSSSGSSGTAGYIPPETWESERLVDPTAAFSCMERFWTFMEYLMLTTKIHIYYNLCVRSSIYHNFYVISYIRLYDMYTCIHIHILALSLLGVSCSRWWYPRGDVFSMGVVFFQLMVGQVPNGEALGVLQTDGDNEEDKQVGLKAELPWPRFPERSIEM